MSNEIDALIISVMVLIFLGGGLEPRASSDAGTQTMPYCQFEDGSDVDGYCLWVDPGTGHGYINPAGFETDTGAYVGGFN